MPALAENRNRQTFTVTQHSWTVTGTAALMPTTLKTLFTFSCHVLFPWLTSMFQCALLGLQNTRLSNACHLDGATVQGFVITISLNFYGSFPSDLGNHQSAWTLMTLPSPPVQHTLPAFLAANCSESQRKPSPQGQSLSFSLVCLDWGVWLNHDIIIALK